VDQRRRVDQPHHLVGRRRPASHVHGRHCRPARHPRGRHRVPGSPIPVSCRGAAPARRGSGRSPEAWRSVRRWDPRHTARRCGGPWCRRSAGRCRPVVDGCHVLDDCSGRPWWWLWRWGRGGSSNAGTHGGRRSGRATLLRQPAQFMDRDRRSPERLGNSLCPCVWCDGHREWLTGSSVRQAGVGAVALVGVAEPTDRSALGRH
jgi:hypothetical protein